ncbi:MAG TPA: EVE domain-containing protein [Phycisphaerales bacterium]|nr:EVE domain-containing protein [Phycisphaerales bacterium]
MAMYLVKTEPSEYSFADLQREKTCVWTGVANPQARIHLRAMKAGDQAFIYHTGDEKAIVGLAKVTKAAYEDPSQPGVNDEGKPKAPVVDLAPLKQAKTPLTLAAIKADKRFAEFALVKSSRLSVMPVPAELEKIVRSMTGL